MSAWARLTLPIAEPAWLSAERATAWVRTLAAVTFIGALAWIAFSHGGVDPTGKPLGTDFISFWTASRLVWDGAPATAAYDPAAHGVLQARAFPGVDVGYTPFPYPPPFLLICLPLGLMPYLPALAVWLGLTGVAWFRAARAWLGEASWLPLLAFPAVLINLSNGQNGFLSGALFGTGALLLRRRPFLAGLCLGALVFKPHLGLLIPFVLLATRNWRALAGATVAAAGLCAASLAAFGPEIWLRFPPQLAMMRQVVEGGLLHPGKVQTVFAGLQLLLAPLGAAYAAQAVTAVMAAAAVAAFAWRNPRSAAIGPLLIAATLLISPYLMDYDLILAAFPLAWLFAEGRRTGFRPWEQAAMLAAYVLPLGSRVLAMHTGLVVAPLVLGALLWAALRRASAPDEGPRPALGH